MAEAPSTGVPAGLARTLAWGGGLTGASVGAFVLTVGWGLGVSRLTDLMAGYATMKANTALAFLLSGAGLCGLASSRRSWNRAGQILAGAGILVGALTLLEYLTGADLGIDQFLIADRESTVFPGRMAPVTAVNFIVIGIAILCTRARTLWPSQLGAGFVAFTAFIALVGYAYDTSSLYSYGPYGSIAVHTALTFAVLAMGVIAARQHDGLIWLLNAPTPGGHLARRFLPVAMFLPVLLGWLRLMGQRAEWFDASFGVALFAVTLTVVLLVLTIQSAAWIDRADDRQRQAEREMERAQHQAFERATALAAVVDSSDDAIIGTSVTGIIRTWNGGAARLYGYSPDEAIGQSIRLIVPPERGGETDRVLAATAAGESITHLQTTRLTKGGRLVDISLTVSPILSASGDLIGTAAIARDVTAQRQVEVERQVMLRRLEDQTAELQRSNDELTQFAYVASHDLQEPLRMVASYTELLASRYQGQLDERADKYIHYIMDGATRMQQLIRDLLNYARVGRQTKPKELVDLNQVAQRVVRNLRALIDTARAEVVIDPLPTVMGDDVQIGQVLQNLIGNAVKFHADRPPRVIVAAEREQDAWRISVEDNGIGIDMRFRDRVFEIFQRLHERGTYDGTGVGLAVVKRIVEGQGGSVWFESTPGQGTRFAFTIPEASPAQSPNSGTSGHT